jgi:hypothetical protein
MKQCNSYNRMMMRFFDRGLNEEETGSLLGHIGECTRCRARFEKLTVILGSLEHAPGAEPPAGLDESVMRAVRALPVPAPALAGMAPVFAAAGILLALALAFALQGNGPVELALAAADTLNGAVAGAWKTQLAADFIGGLFPGLAGSASRLFWNVVMAGAVSSMLVGLRSAVAVRRKA